AEETQEGYEARIAGAVLLNVFEETTSTLAGKPFSEPPTLSEDFPPAIREQVLWDIDLRGNNHEVFLHRWFRTGLSKGFCHVLVDVPRPTKDAEPGKPRTLDDDRREGRRPFWTLVQPERVLFADSEVIDGQEVL